MKKISKRAVVTTMLVLLAFAGLLVFTVQYFVKARTWVSYPGSPHVYAGGNIATGTVKDRDGVTLLTNGSTRTYASDAEVRMATLHLLGDRYGMIEAPLINAYAEELLDYNVITGMYFSDDNGNALNLTISAEACKAALEGLNGRKGTVGVYNYLTGEILCMVSSGTYDPDDPPTEAEIEASEYYSGTYLNRFTSATYVPGSIFKLVTAAAAIDAGYDPDSSMFECTKQTVISGETVTCEEYHGQISFGTGLVKSCNIVFGELAVVLGADVMTKYAEAAGVTTSISFDGTDTEPGQFDVSDANDAALAWAGIGQYTNLVNPCQFMTFVGSIANGGVSASPYVVSSVENPQGVKIYSAKSTSLDRTMSANTAGILAKMMRNDVVYNYGASNFGDLYVCAKSGTAEVDGQEYPNAMFAGFVQSTEYPLAFICVVENAGSGSSVCVPIISEVLNACVISMDAQ